MNKCLREVEFSENPSKKRIENAYNHTLSEYLKFRNIEHDLFTRFIKLTVEIYTFKINYEYFKLNKNQTEVINQVETKIKCIENAIIKNNKNFAILKRILIFIV